MKKLLLIFALLVLSTNVYAEMFECNAFGFKVPQIPVSDEVLARMNVSGGVAINANGKPVTLYEETLPQRFPEEFLNQLLAHECSHHQLGHTRYPSLPSTEYHADCRSMFLLQEQLNYSEKQFTIIYDVINSQEGPTRTHKLQACNSMEDYHDGTQITRR